MKDKKMKLSEATIAQQKAECKRLIAAHRTDLEYGRLNEEFRPYINFVSNRRGSPLVIKLTKIVDSFGYVPGILESAYSMGANPYAKDDKNRDIIAFLKDNYSYYDVYPDKLAEVKNIVNAWKKKFEDPSDESVKLEYDYSSKLFKIRTLDGYFKLNIPHKRLLDWDRSEWVLSKEIALEVDETKFWIISNTAIMHTTFSVDLSIFNTFMKKLKEKEIANIKKELAEARAKVDELEKELTEAKTEIDTLEKNLANLET